MTPRAANHEFFLFPRNLPKEAISQAISTARTEMFLEPRRHDDNATKREKSNDREQERERERERERKDRHAGGKMPFSRLLGASV